ncbi:MAG: hypothetical protein KDI67_08855 [Gammaproteobacteria bacterium]|nr:hypothetical protein [Gammaproteobacteria bacterium]
MESYVDFLKRVGEKEAIYANDLKGNERRIADELMKAGLISDNEQLAMPGIANIITSEYLAITPAGFTALTEWTDYLTKQKWWFKVAASLVRFLWIVVGALIASVSQLINGVMA